jgi:hypothetical protein
MAVDNHPALKAGVLQMTHKHSGGSNTGSEPASATRFDVFISHASQDERLAGVLREMLESRGLTCWLPAIEIQPGENLQERIRAGLNDSRMVLLVLTPATDSPEPWVSAEWSAIQENAWRRADYPILPVVFGDVEPPPFARRWRVLRVDSASSEHAQRVADVIAARARRPEPVEQVEPTEHDQRARHQRFGDIIRALHVKEPDDAIEEGDASDG